MTISFTLNGKSQTVTVADGNTPLVWVLRDQLHLKGTKYGCGQAACGACTIHIDGLAIRSCSYPIKLVQDKKVVTIEGLGSPKKPHAVQQAWLEAVVPQCGYCQPGFIMATAALLNKSPKPGQEEINQALTNICRCGTYYRIHKAIKRACEITETQQNPSKTV